jgi:predicted amidohydrolase YtcJ
MKSFIFRNQFISCSIFTAALLAIFLLVPAAWAETESLQGLFPETDYDTSAPITVFVANQLVTMADDTSNANAVAVSDGMIIDVGSADQLLKRFNEFSNLVVDRQFADKTITPGFIDPHLHLWLFAMLSNAKFITPADWNLPWDDVKGVLGHDAYLQRLKEYETSLKDPNELLLTWGYHQYFHGDLSRDMLDRISSTRPIIVWQRSVHELYFNTRALEVLGYEESDWLGKGEASEMSNWDDGHVWEKGVFMVAPTLFALVASPEKFRLGLERARDYVHAGGITAALDPGVQLTPELLDSMINILESDALPFDYYLVPAGNSIYDHVGKDSIKTVAVAREMATQHGEHIQWMPKTIKLFTDGAVFSQLMQLKQGYLDGHHGEWVQSPEDFADVARAFWNEDYQLLVHTNGDLGMEVVLNTLEKLQQESPRYDHRLSVHHFAYSEKSQVQRLAHLGGIISSNPFYLHVLGEQYSKVGVGEERSAEMVRGRSVLDNGVNLSFHSDAPMAPANPLLLAWAAVNRTGLTGTVLGPQEKITVEEALRAITIGAAYDMGKENEMGSIEVGKRANFAVLDVDPLTTEPRLLKDIVVRATVVDGRVFPVLKTATGLVMSPQNQQKLALLNGQTHRNGEFNTDACSINYWLQVAVSQAAVP